MDLYVGVGTGGSGGGGRGEEGEEEVSDCGLAGGGGAGEGDCNDVRLGGWCSHVCVFAWETLGCGWSD